MMCINESLEIATLTPREFKPDTRVITLNKECQVDINIAPQIRKVRNTTADAEGHMQLMNSCRSISPSLFESPRAKIASTCFFVNGLGSELLNFGPLMNKITLDLINLL